MVDSLKNNVTLSAIIWSPKASCLPIAKTALTTKAQQFNATIRIYGKLFTVVWSSLPQKHYSRTVGYYHSEYIYVCAYIHTHTHTHTHTYIYIYKNLLSCLSKTKY